MEELTKSVEKEEAAADVRFMSHQVNFDTQ
jgi:hypothetical protein